MDFDLFRAEDHFSAHFETYGFRLENRFGKARLVAIPYLDDHERLLVFRLPPQHYGETALDRVQVDASLGKPEIDQRLASIGYVSAKPSTLVFRVPFNKQALPLSGKAMELELSSLLAWGNFEYVTPNIDDPYQNDPHFAQSTPIDRRHLLGLESWHGTATTQTSAIDLPSGFYLQPRNGESYRWRIRSAPKRVGNYIEGWSAFLEATTPGGSVNLELVDVWGVAGGLHATTVSGTAVFSYVNADKSFQFTQEPLSAANGTAIQYRQTPIDFFDRFEVATTLSPRFEEPLGGSHSVFQYFSESPIVDSCNRPVPMSVNACYVALDHKISADTYGVSADGGYLDLKGNWSVLPGCAIKGWVHETTQGRDTFVRLVRKGYLYPFGFEAELVVEVERTYLRTFDGRLVAPLVKQVYVRPVKPTVAAQASSEECFTQIEILTPRTPALDTSEVPLGLTFAELDAFIPRHGGQAFPFEFEGTDVSGKKVRWSIPVYFLSNRQTERNEQGRFAEQPNAALPSNALGANQFYFVKLVAATDCSLPPDPNVAVLNFIKLIDKYWSQLAFRFAQLGGEVIALAPARTSGDTSVEVKWFEWARSVRPPPLSDADVAAGRTYVLRPVTPRVRTARITLHNIRQFSGSIPDMLGTYRDLRVPFEAGVAKPIPGSLDPEEVQSYDQYHTGVLVPDAGQGETGPYFCVLPVGRPGDGTADQRRAALLSAYFPGLAGTNAKLDFLDNLSNLVEFGRAKGTEGLGGLATPDSSVVLLTRKYGPIGDERQTLKLLTQNVPAIASSAGAPGLLRFTAPAGAPPSGLVNIGISSLFGDNAEILPGIKFADVLQYVLKLDDSGPSTGTALAAAAPASGSNALRWNAKITGLDWLTALIESGGAGLNLNNLIQSLGSMPAPTEPTEIPAVGLEATLDWQTEAFRSFGSGGPLEFTPKSEFTGRNTSFAIAARAWLDFLNPRPELSSSCTLADFSLTFLQAIKVDFDHIRFDLDTNGQKRFDPAIANITFTGRLEFINGLKDLLKKLDDKFGVKIEISPARVQVSQKLTFPLGGGVVFLGPATISNLSFRWGVIIPILGRDRTRVLIGLASPEDPMTIAVGWYGGRAYAVIEADTSGPRLIRVSADYGGVFQAAWGGIAKGSVSLTAGFAFTLQSGPPSSIDLFAFAQFTGKLSIVEIFSVCANVIVGLGYKAGQKSVIYGLASCSCSFSLGLAKFSYSYDVYKEERAGDSQSDNHPAAYLTSGGEARQMEAFYTSATDDSGAACQAQLKSVNHFYPFADRAQHQHWEEFFDATVNA